MDVVRKTIADMNCKVLTVNVTDEYSAPVADGYAILEKGGVRVAVIGMVTPSITRWDAANLADCTVTDPWRRRAKSSTPSRDSMTCCWACSTWASRMNTAWPIPA